MPMCGRPLLPTAARYGVTVRASISEAQVIRSIVVSCKRGDLIPCSSRRRRGPLLYRSTRQWSLESSSIWHFLMLAVSKALRPVQPAWNPRGHGRSAASKRCDAMTLPARAESAGKVGAHDLSANNDPIRGQRQHDRVYRSRACVAAEPKPDRHERDEPSDEDVTDHGHPRDPPGLTSGDHPRFEGDRRRHDQDQDRENQPGHKITEALPPAVAGLDAVTVSSSADEPGGEAERSYEVRPAGKPVTQGDLLDRDVPAGR